MTTTNSCFIPRVSIWCPRFSLIEPLPFKSWFICFCLNDLLNINHSNKISFPFEYHFQIKNNFKPGSRFCQKNNVRLAVNSAETKTFFTAKRPHLLALNALKAVNFCKNCVEFCGENHRISYKTETAVHGFVPLTSCMSPISYSTSPSFTYFTNVSCEFKISVEFSGDICKICDLSGEKIFSTAVYW